MYGFCRITDLDILHFYFSSKNCSSKVYTCFAKVVVLVTQSTTKLRLHFFGFFYDFIRILQDPVKAHKRGRSNLQTDPWNFPNLTDLPLLLTHRPLQDSNPRIGIPAAQGGSPPVRWHGGTIELSLSQLAVVAWAEGSPASGGGRTVVARPRVLELRRGQGWSWSTCGTGGFSMT
jgi:hypothetical protein